MKKYIIIVSCVIALLLAFDFAYFNLGWYFPLGNKQPDPFVKTENENILIKKDDKFEKFEIRGVDLGSAVPGQWSADYAISEETYQRWFDQIQKMGANTIRVYSVQSESFYNAFYNYNKNNKTPLYLIQGVPVNDYLIFSHRDAFDEEISDNLLNNCRTAVDVIHGRKKINLGRKAEAATGKFTKDVSDWVIGYIIGIDWEPSTVSYTNEKYKDDGLSHNGKYLYTTKDAAPFETILAAAGDKMIEYETNKYSSQRLIAFSSYPSTDPFTYPEDVGMLFQKYAVINVENIASTDKFLSGQFASYHVYPHQTDILLHIEDFSVMDLSDDDICYKENGTLNDYRTYFNMLNRHHDMPVVISEFGIATGRNAEHEAVDGNGIYSKVSEKEQGPALANCWEDITEAGLNGGCIFSWQDDWSKRSPNTYYAINEERSPYWSDYQTNGQSFGLLSFDPGTKKSVAYVDGDIPEWSSKNVIAQNGDMSLSVKYDEKFIYFLVKKKNLDFENDTVFVPIDTTPKTGSNYSKGHDARFDREADFLLVLNGRENSRLLVQERYELLRSAHSKKIYGFDTYRKETVPDKNSPKFVPINSLVEKKKLSDLPQERITYIPIETGKLVYGNANPESADFDSLADFCAKGDYIEIKIPWLLLNFSDPSKMEIHDDYYDGNYGVTYINIEKKMHVGVGMGKKRISLKTIELNGWNNEVTYHERQKNAYFTMQKLWKGRELK